MALRFLVAFLVVLCAACSGTSVSPQQAPVIAPTPKPDEVSFELTQDQLTQQLNQQLAGQPLGQTPMGTATLKSISAEVANGQVVCNGNAAIGGQDVPVSLASTVNVQQGRPVVVVNDAKAAGLPLPQGARDAAQGAIQTQIDREVTRMQMQVSSVTMSNGKLTLIGTRAR